MTQAIEQQTPSADSGARAALDQLRTLTVQGEAVVAHALQHRLYALIHRRNLAAATTGRFIFLTRRLLGGYEPVTVRWQDIKSASLAVGTFTASLTIAYSANLSDTAEDQAAFRTLKTGGLVIAQAQAVYRYCQEQEQAWREKRRLRSIEEMRARAGGTQIAAVLPQPAYAGAPLEVGGPALPPHEDPADRLARAKDMLTRGLLTDSEYETIKARIIGAL
jgi:hypothetical protein